MRLRLFFIALCSVCITLVFCEYIFREMEESSYNARFAKLDTLVPIRIRPKNEIKILGIGESTAKGEPYEQKIDPLLLVKDELSQEYPQYTFTRHVHGFGGALLARLVDGVEGELRTFPDVIVVIAGHNEFLASFGPQLSCAEGSVQDWLLRSAMIRFFYGRYAQNLASQIPTQVSAGIIQDPVACRIAWQRVLDQSSAAMRALASFGKKHSIPVILVHLLGNEALNPNRNVYRGSENDKLRFGSLHKTIMREIEKGLWDRASSSVQDALKIDPTSSEMLYRKAQIVRRRGQVEIARDLYKAAKEADGLPWRALEVQLSARNAIAAEFGSTVINMRDEMLPNLKPPYEFFDESYFHDMHHPALEGYRMMARAIVREIKKTDVLSGIPHESALLESDESILNQYHYARADLVDLLLSRIVWLNMFGKMSYVKKERMELLLSYFAMLETAYPLPLSLLHTYHKANILQIYNEARSQYLDERKQIGGAEPQQFLKSDIDVKWFRIQQERLAHEVPVRISDIPSRVKVCWYIDCTESATKERPISAAGRKYTSGFVLHPSEDINSYLEFDLPKSVSKFQGSFAIADSGSEKSSASCSILLDDKLVFSSTPLRLSQSPQPFLVSLKGVQKLAISCSSLEDGSAYDHAAILNPVIQ